MQIHLVGGFLGSGKTTAIIAAVRHLIQHGKKVGVITNDQGKFLVDTSFFQLENVPTVEVNGGCFCCNYDKFDQGVTQLIYSIQPDVIFAESVGSCADIVTTVMRPLLHFSEINKFQTTLSVFVDARYLEIDLSGKELPFQDGIVYIFHKQIEEAQLVVINKIDLLSPERIIALQEKFKIAYPTKRVLMQSSIDDKDILHWLEQLMEEPSFPSHSIQLDYLTYGTAEQDLAWYDAKIQLTGKQESIAETANQLIMDIENRIRQNSFYIGHLKFLLCDGVRHQKLSFTALSKSGSLLADFQSNWNSPLTMTINARDVCPADVLQKLVQQSYGHIRDNGGSLQVQGEKAFHPGLPQPTHLFP